MIAISIHQVAKMPVVPAGGSPKPPTILGTLPGGAAVGSVVSLPSLARAVEAIRKLVASGALDGALIGGIGSLGGGPSIALPELQRPTSLSVQSGPATRAPATPRKFPNLEPGDSPKPVGSFKLEFRNGKWVTVSSSGDVFTARGKYIFVTHDGKITVARASDVLRGRPEAKHIDLSRGNPVDYAGEVDFTQKGELRSWSNNSGHYRPDANLANQAELPMGQFKPYVHQ
jgi:hypothetical protein